LLNKLQHLSRDEKEHIVKDGRKWVTWNAERLCSVICYTDEEIQDLTTDEIQSMVSEVINNSFGYSAGLDIIKKLYKTRQTETVEALKLQIKNHILSLSIASLQRQMWAPDRVIKMMVGKEFCQEMGIGWVKEGKDWKTLEQELEII
jgi:hypothetical protein